MKRHLRHAAARGQALVEFCLVVMVFFLMFFAVVDFGRAVYAYNTVSESARQAARLAIVDQTIGNVQTRAIQAAPALSLTNADVDVCFKSAGAAAWAATNGPVKCVGSGSSAPSCGSPYEAGCFAVVTVRSHFSAITPVIGDLIKDFTLESTSVEAIEYVCPTSDHPSCP